MPAYNDPKRKKGREAVGQGALALRNLAGGGMGAIVGLHRSFRSLNRRERDTSSRRPEFDPSQARVRRTGPSCAPVADD